MEENNGQDGWQLHPSGFQFAWRGDELLYRTPGDNARSWKATGEHAGPMLPTPDAVTNFVRASLREPDAYTRVDFWGLGSDSLGDHDITVSHKGPLFPEATVGVTGAPLDDVFESFRAVLERLRDHKRRLEEGTEENAALKERVRCLEEKLGATAATREYAIERLGGERAVAINGKILNADTLTDDDRPADITTQSTTFPRSEDLFGVSYYRQNTAIRCDLPICYRAIRPTHLRIQVCIKTNQLWVLQHKKRFCMLDVILAEIGDSLVLLHLHLHLSSCGGRARLELPSLPKLETLELDNFAGSIENIDCLEGLNVTSPGLKKLTVCSTQVNRPTLHPGTEINWI